MEHSDPMATATATAHATPTTPTASSERQREREFYKYYDPIRALNSRAPQWTDVHDDEAVRRHVPRSSPDHTLTAFCQLGALRLNARRSMLFFFDRQNAYILAEATRTLSLLGDEIHHDVDDALWLGETVIPRGLSICEHTMNMPDAADATNTPFENAGDIKIIHDLTEDVDFCDRPFVKYGPKAKFYAGIPITTPAGVRIGVYCILDDRPRSGLQQHDINFMREMSATVMNHLEMLHARTEFGRQSRMLTGLRTFVKDSTTSGPGPPTSASPDAGGGSSSRRGNLVATGSNTSSSNTSPSRNSAAVTKLVGEHIDMHDYASDSEGGAPDRRAVGQAQKRLDNHLDRDPGNASRHIAQRAADVIRNAVDADGIVFLDASSHPVNGVRTSRGSGTDTATTDGDQDTGSDDSLQRNKAADCRVLGASCRTTYPVDPDHLPIPEKFLKTLLRRHSQGKVWTFNSDGEVSSTEEGLSDSSSKTDRSEKSQRRQTSRKVTKFNEANEIRRLFPDARAVCLAPVWDPIRGRWFAGALMWTYSPLRVFSAEGELAYLMAFSDVVMAKISRREARLTDQAKTDFISSVSHELRSPLHGIVGSLELLQDRDTLDHALLSQMEKCASTLTDVVEHLLDFAKVNHHVSRPRQRGLTDRHRQDSVSRLLSTGNTVQPLTKLTEEVADAIFYSHCCNVGPEASSKVDFIVDVSTATDFSIRDAVGAWKRVCSNLVGNALKFTASGHVQLSLKVLTRKRKPPVAILAVSDTGCGMSPDFVRTGLFRAFSQENPLTTGTGLGLSVVAKLVKGLGGKIEVESVKDSGTTITVAIPLEPVLSKTEALPCDPLLESARVGLLDPELDEDEGVPQGPRLHLSSVEGILRQAGAQLTSSRSASVNLVFESQLIHLQRNGRLKGQPEGAHLIVLCHSLLSAFQMQNSEHSFGNVGHVEFISQPYGPDRVRTALSNCLQSSSRRSSGTSELAQQVSSRADATTLPSHLRRLYEEKTNLTPAHSPPYSSSDSEGTSSSAEISFEGAACVRDNLTGSATQRELAAAEAKLSKKLMKSAVAEASKQLPEEPSKQRKLSLLLVDDNPVNLRLLSAYADKNKHPQLTATDGQEAVNAYKNSALATNGISHDVKGSTTHIPKPDVVFLDINMPVLDGFQAARQIRAFEKEARIPPTILVALTCLGSEDAKQEAEACGIDMFLTKPVRPRELTKILDSLSEVADFNKRGLEALSSEIPRAKV